MRRLLRAVSVGISLAVTGAIAAPVSALAQSTNTANAASAASCAAISQLPLYRLFPKATVAACDPTTEAGQLQLARAAAQANNFERVKEFGQPLFDANLSEALPLLGILAEQGLGQRKDTNEAFFVFRGAAADGVPGGAAGYGRVALHQIEEMARLKPEAAQALKTAVLRRDYSAIEPLARAHLRGRYVTRSGREALRLVTMGVEANHPESIYQLGTWYLNGTVVTANRGRALDHFRRAALLGEPRALFALGFYGAGGNTRSAAVNMIEGYVRTISPAERTVLYQRMRRMKPDEVRFDVQRLLNVAGLDTGGVDGALGRKTRAALEAFRTQRYAWPES